MSSLQSLERILSNQPRERIHFDLSFLEPAITESVRYLDSPEAQQSIEVCPYWPKWDSPWWHMAVLFEMGMADKIPKAAARQMFSEINATHYPYFFRDQPPKEKTPKQDAPCPCSFGNIYQILTATGVNVDAELPWARGWFVKYQMLDGGLNCDEDAYKADENASSLVGTISPLEAILCTPKKITPEEERFLDRGAKCLIDRELRLGSSSKHNAEERLDEADWLKPCFPRLYIYDVLRGLNFVLRWAEQLNRRLPASAITQVVGHLCASFPDGKVQAQRFSYEGVGTKLFKSSGSWERGYAATIFPLLTQLSELNRDSPFLTAKWQEAVLTIDRLSDRGLIA
jgi:hypothetical protein